MFGKVKKTVSVAYKEKLLAEIAHYEKRIDEALNKRTHNSFKDESMEDVTNPYKLNLQPSLNELKQREASLSDRVSMTLELANLTIMQSEVNVMLAPPEVRKPVPEDGIWHEVEAKCKIDLVSFTISFYAHKPHRRFAPIRFRNVAVTLVKPAHQKELDQSILPKLHVPNLALQVLQSYATAFRSRRTTLRELTEKYGDKLTMEPMSEGGYRVKFLDLLQVDWTLENLWSPVVPFCHRMKFELEYMPKDYIQAISKLYKQFKDPSLDTSERTHVLARIFEVCLQAAGPARDLHESFESDPETAGRLHERRTTIDQEPDVPRFDHSPKKPSGKENKPNRKTSMAPPKTIPKKAKKRTNRDDNRKSVKRPIESESSNDSKRTRVENDTSKGGLKGGNNGGDGKDGETGAVKSKRDAGKDVAASSELEVVAKTSKVAKKPKETDKATENDANKNRDGKTVKLKASDTEGNENDNDTTKKGVVNSKGSSETSSKGSKNSHKIVARKETENNLAVSEKCKVNVTSAKNTKPKDKNTVKSLGKNVETNVASLKNNANVEKEKLPSKTILRAKDTRSEKAAELEKVAEKVDIRKSTKKVSNAKNDEISVVSSKGGSKKSETNKIFSKNTNAIVEDDTPNSRSTNIGTQNVDEENNAKAKVTNAQKANNTKIVSKTNSKTSKGSEGDIKTTSKSAKGANKAKTISKEDETSEKETNLEVVKNRKNVHKAKTDVKPAPKASLTTKTGVDPSQTKTNDEKEKMVKDSAKIAENKNVKEKPLGVGKSTAKSGNIKETTQLTEKRKLTITKSNEKISENEDNKTNTKAVTDETKKTSKNDEVLAKIRKPTEPVSMNTINIPAKTTTEKPNKPKVSERILKENPNRQTLQSVVENNKISKTKKPEQKSNMLNATITKSKIIPISKIPAETQIKIADKLRTKIPMMKTKTTFASLSDKLKGNNFGKISRGVDNTKIPQKSLPVFKKVAKNLPTRISPRKLPTFKASTQEFSNK